MIQLPKVKTIKALQTIVTTLVATMALSGCSYVVKSGANIAIGFSEKNIVPPILAMGDVDMICNTGTALTPAIMSTQDMGADPTRIAVLLYAASGMCAENQALEQDLRYLRASKAGQVTEAQDARIAQKRLSAIAARRQYMAYQLFASRWQTKYHVQLGESCPKMKTDLDETIYMLGLLSGVQAVTNDINSGGEVNIPKDIAGIAERGMACLDNNKYWGVPNATRAVLWTLLPGAGDGKPDPYVTLKQSMQIGEQKGVRLSYALYAVAAQASGDNDKIRDALKSYAASVGEGKPVNPNFRLLDAMAGVMVRGISDRYWTENTGVRTSDNGMTIFWDEQNEPSNALDDLFDDSSEPATSEAATSESQATSTPDSSTEATPEQTEQK